ncbi:transposase [Verminephrobacter eiseniae EF01-2]|uniref:Transposase n=1 Tax=Verminephrobacter eiseniae (strain EF01-2) TaxID=391735 RepID=A1WQD1_VEREI|nr:transposase [Verminephrobacter eiseniae EF01-2]
MADVPKAHRFNGREDMQQTLPRYVARHDHPLPQSALGRKTPVQAMKDDWRQEHPPLLHERPYPPPVRGAGMGATRPPEGDGAPVRAAPKAHPFPPRWQQRARQSAQMFQE